MTKKLRGKGRKKENRIKRISVRMTIEEYEKAQDVFKHLNIKAKSAFIRKLISGEAIKENKNSENPAMIEKMDSELLYQLNKIGGNMNQIAKRLNSVQPVELYKTESDMIINSRLEIKFILDKIIEIKGW